MGLLIAKSMLFQLDCLSPPALPADTHGLERTKWSCVDGVWLCESLRALLYRSTALTFHFRWHGKEPRYWAVLHLPSSPTLPLHSFMLSENVQLTV